MYFGLAMIFGAICFCAGVAFAYFITVPFMLGFLISFTNDVNVRDSISIGEYLNFLVTVFLIFGTVFEMPVISVILTRMGIIRAEWLAKARKVMIVVIFFLAAVITPPDVVSQVMVALPMLALYEIAILLSRIFRRK
jgi:sec-independent protein translocase protein TatC